MVAESGCLAGTRVIARLGRESLMPYFPRCSWRKKVVPFGEKSELVVLNRRWGYWVLFGSHLHTLSRFDATSTIQFPPSTYAGSLLFEMRTPDRAFKDTHAPPQGEFRVKVVTLEASLLPSILFSGR